MLSRIVSATLVLAGLTHAAVTRVEIAERVDLPIANYEQITGKVYFAVDPKLPNNQIIADIDKAPKNAAGLVEFSSDLIVLRPKDPAKGNGTALLEISNRGGRGMLGMFDLNNGRQLQTKEDFGDPLLFEQGFTLVWVGWEFDIPERAGAMHLYAPVIKGLTGLVRSEIEVDKKATTASLGDRNQVPYVVADPASDRASATMTVRDHIDAPRTTIPHAQWSFTADGGHVDYPAGFEPGRYYEIVYTAKDPALVGLGPAAVRDYISYIKQNGEAKRAIGFGTSQSGRFLRTFLYYGFNADEKGKKVFDGVWAHVAGAGRGSFNLRFAQPSRDGNPIENNLYPVDIFPFTDEPETDGGITDSILARATKDGVVPKVFYTNGSYEYWGRAASLIHITPDGKKDVPPAPNTRIYYNTGASHNANAEPNYRNTQDRLNPDDYRYAMRALLISMNKWITDGTAPPDSLIPRIGKDDLVTRQALAFPKIPNVTLPDTPYLAWRLDFGPDFRKGIVTNEPPKMAGKPFPLLIPQVDRDGNETSGLRLPEQSVPLGTLTGWNLRNASIGGSDIMSTQVGSFIPFARTKAEREKSGDPRLSLEERYGTKDAFLQKVDQAAQSLVRDRLLLASDVAKVTARASTQWDSVMNPK
jgi:hypothetical protein